MADIAQVLDSGLLTHGIHLEEFEHAFGAAIGVSHALGVSSGGAALELALKAIGIAGKEVIVPTDTFVATANAVILAGGVPIFADISPDTLSLGLKEIQAKISPRTAGVITVHMFGNISPDIFEIKEFCRSKGLFFVEDAAHAHGASFQGVPAGAIGDVGCFSFYPSKVMTTGEGGMVTTNNLKLANDVKRLRNHGKALSGVLFEVTSNNYRLPEIPAILGKHQVGILKENVRRRNAVADCYRNILGSSSLLSLLPAHKDLINSFWRYPILLREGVDRAAVQRRMEERDVRVTWMYEPLCHQQPVFKKFVDETANRLPQAESCMSRLICLPCYPSLNTDQATYVAESLKGIVESMGGK